MQNKKEKYCTNKKKRKLRALLDYRALNRTREALTRYGEIFRFAAQLPACPFFFTCSVRRRATKRSCSTPDFSCVHFFFYSFARERVLGTEDCFLSECQVVLMLAGFMFFFSFPFTVFRSLSSIRKRISLFRAFVSVKRESDMEKGFHIVSSEAIILRISRNIFVSIVSMIVYSAIGNNRRILLFLNAKNGIHSIRKQQIFNQMFPISVITNASIWNELWNVVTCSNIYFWKILKLFINEGIIKFERNISLFMQVLAESTG